MASRTRRAGAPGQPTCPIVGVGASAGGLEAFKELLRHLPIDTGMAFILVQHLAPSHASFLPEALSKATQMPVSQVEDGTTIEADHVFIIPPNAEMGVLEDQLTLFPRSEARGPHLAIDFFFRSLAGDRRTGSIGVVLSGTASDGTEGLRAIKAAGGITFAQEPKTASFPGMPQSAVDAGVADYSLPVAEIAREIVRLSHRAHVAAEPSSVPVDELTLRKILLLVRQSVGVDFSEYKHPSIQRRLARRIAFRRVGGLKEYLTLLQKEPAEAHALFEDVLIHVTSFFRDVEVYEKLKARVFPEIVKSKPEGAGIRIWVAGCSTGEEVFSLAIALLEFLGSDARPVQIFGSDLSEKAIAKARAGLYADGAMKGVSEERRRRYFEKVEGGYRIVKSVRDLCVFVQHDMARDPPFSRLDLASCRNVLIYFDAALQERLVPILHYSLNQPGFLLLGKTEGISGFDELFRPLDGTSKIFSRAATQSLVRFAVRPDQRLARSEVLGPRSHSRRLSELGQQFDQVLLGRYAPPGVLINEKMEILQVRGRTGAYLEPAPGDPQLNLIKMARPGLLSTLRATLAQAKKERAPVTRRGVAVEQEGVTRVCDLVVVPFTAAPDGEEPLFAVLFEPAAARRKAPPKRALPAPGKGASQRARRLEQELTASRQYLESLIEQHGRATEELGAANEELVSGNEELQSMNEELETAKEELQSTNEELTTVNDELQNRNEETAQINSDLLNLLSAVDIPILILDSQRRIRRFTPRARSILNVLPTDVGRPLDDLNPNLAVADLDQRVQEVIETVTMQEAEVRDGAGHWYLMQLRPYKTIENKIDGAILSLVDIDAHKQQVLVAERATGEAERAKAQAEKATREAERANRAKDDFLATVSHELRSPLSLVMMNAQMLSRGEVTADRVKQACQSIERSTRLQVQLIEDLLDVARITSGKIKMEFAPVELAGVVRAAVESASAPAASKSIRLDAALGGATGTVSGDAGRLQQVVTNLLSNAIKFTPAGGAVEVGLTTDQAAAVLTVRDTGIGIAPDFLPRVFDRFAQDESARGRQLGGLGLGLAIVRHLVEMHGGTVRAQSEGVGTGATFSVTLPLIER